MVMENRIARKILAAGVAVFYSATNVLFCHSAESAFWSARREAARKINKNGGESASASRSAGPTDALVLAQLPGGMRFDVHSPAPAYVTPVPAKEHLVGGKVPVFSSDLPRWLGDVVTPYGNIRDVHLSKRPGAPLVIHIQDLHDSTEAQRNIAGLVEALQDERGVSLVGLEGAQGAFATEGFRSFPDAEITKAVATYFMEEGYLGGPEFAGITAKRVPLLWGVEDMAGYNANVTAVKESAQNRPAVELFLREARTLLNEIKTRRLSPALLEFDRNFSAYQSRKMPLGAYVRYLLKSAPSGSARAPNLVLLRDALTWEDSLDFPRIERERASLLEQMVRVLPKQQLKTLVDKSALYRLGRISYGDYYRFFRTLCEENGIPLTDYRQLHAYVRYVLLAERINRNDLLNELTALELSVQDQLISRPKERRVVNAARHLGQLERLVRHSYTPADWGYHILHEEQIRNVGLTVRALAKEEGLPETLSPPSVEMLKPFENFCLQALGRNGAMVGNLLEKMAAEKRPSAVLVAGGFHTDGMTQLFRQKDVSYVVVTPKVNGELPDGHRTLDILARDPAPLEKLFAGETVNIPTPGMTNGQNAVSNPLARKFATLFVVISLGLTALTTGESVNTPTTPALPNVLTANAVPDQRGAVVTVGEKGNQQPFAVRYVSDGQPSVGFRAAVPGYGEVDVSPASQGGGWRGFLSFLIAGIRVVRGSISSQAVTPVHSGAATGDATKQPKATSTVQLSDIGLLLLPLEELADGLPAEGISKQQLTAGVSEKTRLPNVSDDVRQRIVAKITEGFAGDTIVTPEGIRKLVAQLRLSQGSGNYTADLLHNLRWLDRFRVSLPRLYYLFVGAWETYAFLFLALPSLSALLLGSGFVPPLIAGCGTILMAVGVFWIFHPIFRWLLGGRPRTFSVLVAELRLEWNLAKMHFFISRLFGAIVFASIFVSVSALPVANSDMLAWVVTALVHSVWDIKMAGLRLGDPIDLQFVGRLRAWRAILLGRADKLWLVRLDGDNISLKNMRFDPLTGVLPGERASSDLIYESDSLFLEFKEITRQFFVEEGAYVSRGEGGDEFEVVIEGSKEQVEMALNRVRQRISSYFFDGPHAPVFVELRSNLKREELIGNLKKVGGLAGVAVHGDNYLVRYKKDKNGTSRSVEEIVQQINGIAGTSGSVVPYNDNDVHDVGFFTISMGAVNANEVANALGRNGNEVSRAQANQLVTWGFRWANAALKTAKDEGRNRVHLATVDDIQSFKKERKKNGDEPKPTPGLLEWLKNSFTRPSNDDLIPGALTMPQLRTRLKRTPWRHLTMVTVAGYLGAVSPRAFHTLQEQEGMTHADGNGVIVKIFNSLKTTLPTTSDVARKRPDTFFVVSDSPPNAAQPVQSELSGFKALKSIELDPLVINFNLSFDVFSSARSLALPNGTLKNSLNANLPDVFMGKIGDMIQKKLALAAESNQEGIENLVKNAEIERLVDVVVSGSSVEIIVSSQKLVDLAVEFEKHIALERKKAGDELMRLSREKTKQLNEGREKDQTPVVKDRLNNRVVDAMEFILKDRKIAQSVVGNKWFQTLAMPLIELPLMPLFTVALAWALLPATGLALPILVSSFVLANWHGKPVSIRGPPERVPANLQTWSQFLVRLGFAVIINSIALLAGGVPLESLFQAQFLDISSIDFVRLISYAYSLHAFYNFFAPEQYRLSLVNRTSSFFSYKPAPIDARGILDDANRRFSEQGDTRSEAIRKALGLVDSADPRGPPSRGVVLAAYCAQLGADVKTIVAALLSDRRGENVDDFTQWLSDQQELPALDFANELPGMLRHLSHVTRGKYVPKRRDLGTVRNYMGWIAQGLGDATLNESGAIEGNFDQVAILVWADRLTTLALLPGRGSIWHRVVDGLRTLVGLDPIASKEQMRVYHEIVDVHAHFAERFSYPEAATFMRDEMFRLVNPRRYAKVKRQFEKVTGIPYEEAPKVIEEIKSKINSQFGDDAPRPEIYGRVKGIYSIDVKTKRKSDPLNKWKDLFGLYVIYDGGGDNPDRVKTAIDSLKVGDYIENQHERPTGTYGAHKLIFRKLVNLSSEVKVEVQVLNPNDFSESKVAEGAHWVYGFRYKNPGTEVTGPVAIDYTGYTGQFKHDLGKFILDAKEEGWNYLLVDLPNGKTEPIRLTVKKDSVPTFWDLLGHGRVDGIKSEFDSLKVVSVVNGVALDTSGKVQMDQSIVGGSYLAVNTINNARLISPMVQHIIVNSHLPRTKLMAALHRQNADLGRLTREGRNVVFGKLDPAVSGIFGESISPHEKVALATLAKKLGLGWSVNNLYAYIGLRLEDTDELVKQVVSILTDVKFLKISQSPDIDNTVRNLHDNTQALSIRNKIQIVEVIYNYDRPGLVRDLMGVFEAHGLRQITFLNGEGNQIRFSVEGSSNKVDEAIRDSLMQIPDRPSEGFKSPQTLLIEITDKKSDLFAKLTGALHFSSITEGPKYSDGKYSVTVQCERGFEVYLKDRLKDAFPGSEISITRQNDNHNLGTSTATLVASAFGIIGLAVVLTLIPVDLEMMVAAVVQLGGMTDAFEGVMSLFSDVPGFDWIKLITDVPQDALGLGTFSMMRAEIVGASVASIMLNMRLNGKDTNFDLLNRGDDPYGKIVRIVLKEMPTDEFYLEEENVSVVYKDDFTVRVYQEENGQMKCDINGHAIDRWNKNDSNAPGRDTNIKKFTAYTRTQLHTAVLAAMARYILNGSDASDVEQAIANVGLTEEAVHKLFLEGAKSEAIRELQNNRFVTLLFTSWAVQYSDILPIGKPGQLQMAISPKMTFDKGLNRAGLEALGKFDLGVREGESLDEKLWDLAKKNQASKPPVDFIPNSLAMALHKYADESGVSAKVMKQRLAVNLLSRMSGQQMAKNETELFEMWRVLAVLFGLNGNLSEGRVKDETLKDYIRKVRRHLQNLDFTFLVNLSYTKGMELNTQTDLAEKGVEQFNNVAQEAFSLRDPHQAITESFEKGEDILIYVSPRMAKGLKNDLTPAEQTQIEMLTLLSKRLVNSDDMEAAAWRAKKKRIVFAVVGTQDQVWKLDVSKGSLLLALMRLGADVSGLSRSADSNKIKLEFAKFMPENKSETVSAKSEFGKLNIDQVSLFALDVKGVTVDYSGVKDNIMSFILALAGGLMTQVAPGIVESLKKQQAVKRSA